MGATKGKRDRCGWIFFDGSKRLSFQTRPTDFFLELSGKIFFPVGLQGKKKLDELLAFFKKKFVLIFILGAAVLLPEASCTCRQQKTM